MINNKKIRLLVLLLGATSLQVSAQLFVRPHMGAGYLNSNNVKQTLSHLGVRLLAAVDSTHNYGLEFSQFTRPDNSSFQSIGIVLEQKKNDSFSMSIGTVGYFNYKNTANPIGLMTNLGWEPSNNKQFKPFITFRQDIVFAQETAFISSLSTGLGITF